MAWKGWEKGTLHTESGERAEAVFPVIISASRATDIPAFYADWLMERLQKGYVKWKNPFAGGKEQYISFAKTRVIVFWTKNPAPLLKYLPTLTEMGLNFYFLYTVNDYVQEAVEPFVPSLAERIETFRQLSACIGKERVIWRFDPLLLVNSLTAEDLLAKILQTGNQLYPYTEKLIISFADIAEYPSVQRNLQRAKISWRSFSASEVRTIAAGLSKINQTWNLELAACAEPFDLRAWGILPNRCIDDTLLRRCFSNDAQLMAFLGREQQQLSLFEGGKEKLQRDLKDPGQRRDCGCIVSKDIGQYNTCTHGCVYCYANHRQVFLPQRRNGNTDESLV